MPTAQAGSRLSLSQLASGALQSEIRAMSVECDRIGGINLAQGICDTPVPAVVEAAASRPSTTAITSIPVATASTGCARQSQTNNSAITACRTILKAK